MPLVRIEPKTSRFFLSFLSIYTASSSHEDYVQVFGVRRSTTTPPRSPFFFFFFFFFINVTLMQPVVLHIRNRLTNPSVKIWRQLVYRSLSVVIPYKPVVVVSIPCCLSVETSPVTTIFHEMLLTVASQRAHDVISTSMRR